MQMQYENDQEPILNITFSCALFALVVNMNVTLVGCMLPNVVVVKLRTVLHFFGCCIMV